MNDEFVSSYLESDKEGYVLVHKRAFIAQSHSVAFAVEFISSLTGENPANIAETISAKSLIYVRSLEEEEVEEIISDAIKTFFGKGD